MAWSLETFHELYRDLYRPLVVYAMRFVDDEAESQDVVQDAFVNLWTTHSDIIRATVQAYLYNSVRNQCISRLRQRKTQQRYIDEVMARHPVIDPSNREDQLLREEVLQRVMQTVDSMPPQQRRVFLMVMEGKKNKDIAAALSLSEGTVKTHRKRALATLRRTVGDHDYLLILLLLANL